MNLPPHIDKRERERIKEEKRKCAERPSEDTTKLMGGDLRRMSSLCEQL
jgi:hypothetical protein